MNKPSIPLISKSHRLLIVTRLHDHGAVIQRAGKVGKYLTEDQAKRIDHLLRDDTKFRGWYCPGGWTFMPLTESERRQKLAARKRNTQMRTRRALGMVPDHGGWTGHWQRR